jgi:hypothetical protein
MCCGISGRFGISYFAPIVLDAIGSHACMRACVRVRAYVCVFARVRVRACTFACMCNEAMSANHHHMVLLIRVVDVVLTKWLDVACKSPDKAPSRLELKNNTTLKSFQNSSSLCTTSPVACFRYPSLKCAMACSFSCTPIK